MHHHGNSRFTKPLWKQALSQSHTDKAKECTLVKIQYAIILSYGPIQWKAKRDPVWAIWTWMNMVSLKGAKWVAFTHVQWKDKMQLQLGVILFSQDRSHQIPVVTCQLKLLECGPFGLPKEPSFCEMRRIDTFSTGWRSQLLIALQTILNFLNGPNPIINHDQPNHLFPDGMPREIKPISDTLRA